MKILLIFFILSSHFSFGQNMEKHLWKNRVLLIFTADKNSADYQHQMTDLEKETTELVERKLVIYSFTKEEHKLNFDIEWKKSEELFTKFNPKKREFAIWLIGLDGGIKMTQEGILYPEKLFSIIDGMPMRKREIRKN